MLRRALCHHINGALEAHPCIGMQFGLNLRRRRGGVVALVARHRVPAIYSDLFFVKIGGFAFYGPDRMEGFRRSADYVDPILRGEKPGDLPFQQPTKYELMINRTAARALGLDLSPALLALADEVIE
jgi:putative tryptophan/tyrosine transport system substrate-binding protein